MSPSRLLLLCCMGIILYAQTVGAEQQVVLVAAATSPLSDLDSLELRKIYLGFSVWRNGKIIKGLRNSGDRNLNRIFLQSVVAMSEKSYKRRLLAMIVREGVPRPPEYGDQQALLEALSKDPYSVSYMWEDEAVHSPQVKILRVLWHQY